MTELLFILILISILWNGYNSYMIFEHKLNRRSHVRGKNAFDQDVYWEEKDE